MKRNRKKKKARKSILWIIGVCIGLIALIYIFVAVFFATHFFLNTEINGYDASGKTAVDVEAHLKKKVKEYSLTVLEKDNHQELINGTEINLVYQENGEVEKALKRQNGFLWPKSLFFNKKEKVVIELSYDAGKLTEKVKTLRAMTQEQIPAQSARPKFDGNQFVVDKEVYGTAVNEEVLAEKITASLQKLEPEIDLEKEKCYATPKYTSESKEVQEACKKMNQYCEASITYTMGNPVVIDKKVISTWMLADDEMNVSIDEAAIKKWLEEFGNKYDTVGATRTFTTITGKEATVTGGTYGWSINEDAEFTTILNAVKNGETITKEPEYYIGGTAASHEMEDWGSTYIDVDLSAQHMWYIVDGAVVLETDVVTGVPIPERITPEGVYSIQEKTTDAILVGDINPSTGEPSYRTHVSYWMRVTWDTGIGLHDATWQTAFGGALNQNPYIGSHGCINMPLDQAAALYGMVEINTPVVVHY